MKSVILRCTLALTIFAPSAFAEDMPFLLPLNPSGLVDASIPSSALNLYLTYNPAQFGVCGLKLIAKPENPAALSNLTGKLEAFGGVGENAGGPDGNGNWLDLSYTPIPFVEGQAKARFPEPVIKSKTPSYGAILRTKDRRQLNDVIEEALHGKGRIYVSTLPCE